MAATGFAGQSYETLHRWSISEPGPFWSAVWDECGVIGDKGDTTFVPPPEGSMLGGRWFVGAQMNFAENLLRGDADRLAVIESDEAGAGRRITMGELRREVARVADGLRAAGVAAGDCVGGVLPNRVEGLVALLATASLGAVWSSCSPDFGAMAVLDRLGQIAPKVLFAAPRYRYGGREHDIGDRLGEIIAGMPSLEAVVLCGGDGIATKVKSVEWAAFGDAGAALRFDRQPFEQPLYVLYTSGTTGKPKAIVHCAGGVLLQHLKEHQLHCDLKPGDVIGWYTNVAWMMYHWVISGLASEATVVLTDGAPIPKSDAGLDPGLLWRVAADTGMTHLGISPKYLHTVAETGYAPGETVDLSRFRVLMSAGAPVAPDQFDWMYTHVKRDMMFASISGGTEIIGCFFIGNPTLPVRRGHLTCKALGHAVAVLDSRNVPVIGRKGELVCTEPFPSMPLTFWGEGGAARYFDTYFAQRPGIWTHGDLAEETIHGAGIIYGRTDTTLKPGGVRIGTSEIYATVERFAEIADCLVFGAPVGGDEEIVLCLQATENGAISADLAARIRKAIREAASPRHVPHRIHAIPAVPYTLNGKRVEGAARSSMLGIAVKNLDSLSNPEALEAFRTLSRDSAL
ncbi:acetoacetyl-CoA synthetase [Devosia pacifica]|uniref:Acetoacetyl-CoA synthetase n=2 Tax=Devosia pacifica TaxID=1335967 RepID=A0A918S5D9_9HYPH|nr:acetoacetyl-CoA synthetase [Devosia pacifica]